MSALLFPGWVEAMAVVPSGISVSATNPGGGPSTCVLAPGNYFLTGSSGLVAAVQASLNASRPPDIGAGWTVRISTSATDGLNATGLVTIDCSNTGAKQTKTGGVNSVWDSGASSVQTIAGDGFVEMCAVETNDYRIIGLSSSDPDRNYNTVQYGIQLDGASNANIYESGNLRASVPYVAGDIFRVVRTGTTITYLKNGTTVYTSAIATSAALMIDTSIYNTSATLSGIRFYDATNGYYNITWQNVTNVSDTTTSWSIDMSSGGDLLSLFGFNSIPFGGQYPVTAPAFCDGLWFPNSPLILDGDPREFPILSDRRSTEGPTGIVSTIVGSVKYHHENLKWQAVPFTRYREQAAYTTRCSYENWIKVTQLGQGGYVWYQPGSAIQIYDHTNQLVGSDAYGGSGPTYGWTVPDVNRVRATRLSKDGWSGVWTVLFPNLVSQG